MNLALIHILMKYAKRASCKIHALSRIAPYMNLQQKNILMNAFFNSQFNYCPLIWMCHSRTMNNKINRLHERCLRIIYCDHLSSFNSLLQINNNVTIHHRNIQYLAIEMYKVYNRLSPLIVSEIFLRNDNAHYKTRNVPDFIIPRVRTVNHGSESISVLGPKIWEIIPSSYKNLPTLDAFKQSIKKWIPIECPCRLCKTYIQGVGFI